MLEEAIIRIDGEHVRESQWLVKENLRLLHQFSDSNRNARRLALIVKELQVLRSLPPLLMTLHSFMVLDAQTSVGLPLHMRTYFIHKSDSDKLRSMTNIDSTFHVFTHEEVFMAKTALHILIYLSMHWRLLKGVLAASSGMLD